MDLVRTTEIFIAEARCKEEKYVYLHVCPFVGMLRIPPGMYKYMYYTYMYMSERTFRWVA